MVDIGERLYELREDRGWTQRRLAEEARISQVTVTHVETGKVSPRLPTVRRLARAFGMSTDEFLYGGNPEGPPPEPSWKAELRTSSKEEKRSLALAAQGMVSNTWPGAASTKEILALKGFMSKHGIDAEGVLEALIEDTPGLEEMLDRLEERARAEEAKFAREAQKAVEDALEHGLHAS